MKIGCPEPIQYQGLVKDPYPNYSWRAKILDSQSSLVPMVIKVDTPNIQKKKNITKERERLSKGQMPILVDKLNFVQINNYNN